MASTYLSQHIKEMMVAKVLYHNNTNAKLFKKAKQKSNYVVYFHIGSY